MWERVTSLLESRGRPVLMGRTILRIEHRGGLVRTDAARNDDGAVEAYAGSQFVSSIPMRELVRLLEPAPPVSVLDAANKLGFRDFISIALMIERPDLFPGNWIYIHHPSVKVGRIQNFKNWSPDMVPDQTKTCLGLEYFCFEGDGLWTMDDAALIDVARKELAQLGMCSPEAVFDGVVVRQQKAYPVYDDVYQA